MESSDASTRNEKSNLSSISPLAESRSFAPDPRPFHSRSFLYQWKPFRGMVNDVQRRLPFYFTDWTGGLEPKNLYRVIAATIRIYFLNLMPALAYTLDMNARTGGNYGINETLLSSAIAGLVFSVLSCQPITIVGITGLINLFVYTTYDIVQNSGIDYLQFQAWVMIWSGITHFLVAIFNVSDYTRFITDMTGETFGLYVGVIYIQKGVELLVLEFTNEGAGWFNVVVTILFALFVYYLEKVGTNGFGPFWLRKSFTDYSFAAVVIFMTGFVHIPGNIENAGIEFLPITPTFQPSTE